MELSLFTPGLIAYLLFLAALLGGVMGSFATCMAWRITQGESFLSGRSHCDTCAHTLGLIDLVPILSWLFLRGRCRHCGVKISPRSFGAEFFCALAFVTVVLRFGLTAATAQALILTTLLLAVALVDYDTMLIPNGLLLAIFINWLAFLPLAGGDILSLALRGLLGGLTASVPLLVLVLLMDRVLGRESMGGGDIKLFFVTGLYFRWQETFFLLILSCLLGIFFGLLAARRPEQGEGSKPFPFGPAIAAAVYLSLLVAERAVGAYLALF